jgi:hypothetical protein
MMLNLRLTLWNTSPETNRGNSDRLSLIFHNHAIDQNEGWARAGYTPSSGCQDDRMFDARVKLTRGLGTRTASRAMKSRGPGKCLDFLTPCEGFNNTRLQRTVALRRRIEAMLPHLINNEVRTQQENIVSCSNCHGEITGSIKIYAKVRFSSRILRLSAEDRRGIAGGMIERFGYL